MAMRKILNITMIAAGIIALGGGGTGAYMIHQNNVKAAQTRQIRKDIKTDKATVKDQYTKINWYNLALVENKIQGKDVKISSPVIDGYNRIQKTLNDTQKAFNDNGGEVTDDGAKIPKSAAYKKVWNDEYLPLFDRDNISPYAFSRKYIPLVSTNQKADYYVDTGNAKANGTVTYLIHVTSSDDHQATYNYLASYDLQEHKITSLTTLTQPAKARGLE